MTQIENNRLLSDFAETTDTVTGNIADKIEAQTKLYQQLRNQLFKLEKSNETIKEFLGLSVPGDISGMLNNSRTRSDGTTSSPGVTIKESYRLRESSP